MAGIWLDQAFPVYPHGFPKELIEEFERQIGRRTIGNKPASGTEIIKELGEEHVRTGFPDRLHLGRQRFPDRRARRRDSRSPSFTACAKSRASCSTGRIAWAA